MLIVPQATTIGGRSANVGTQPQLQIGAAAAEVGGRVFDLASKMIATRVQYKTQEDTLNMTTDFAKARLAVDQLTDPSQVGPSWDAHVADIQAKYLPTDAKGNVALDPREADVMRLAFADLSGKHTEAIAGNVVNLQRSSADAAWIGARDRMTTQAVVADLTTFDALLAQGEAQIDQRLKAGLTDPAGAEKEHLAFRQEMYAGRADQAIAADPQVFLDQVGKGEWQELGATGLAQGQKAAQDALARQGKQQGALANDQLDAMIALSAKGVSPAQRTLLADPTFRAAADPTKLAQADASVRLVDEMPTIGQLAMPDLKAAIAAEAAKPKTDAWQTQKLDLMQKQASDKQAALTKDGAAFLQAQGAGFAPLPTTNPADPAFEAAVKARLVDAQHYSATEGLAVQPFTLDEQAQIKAMADPKTADPKTRAQLAGVLGRDLGMKAAGSLAGDLTFGWTAGLTAAGGTTALATEIMKGQTKLAVDAIVLPPLQDRLQGGFDTLGVTLSDMAGDPAMKSALTAADALYAARQTNPGDANTFDIGVYAQALHEVLGGTGSYDSGEARGGMQTIRDQITLLPMGVRGTEVETDLATVSVLDPKTFQTLMGLISTRGGVPMIHGLPVPPSDLEGAHIEAVADDTYRFVTDSGTTFEDRSGQPFEFRLLGSGTAMGLLGVSKP